MTLSSREILCGVSYLQIVACAGMNQRAAAERLGVNEGYFRKTVKRLGLRHWFTDIRPRPRCISREDIVQVASEGYTRRDAAYLLGISPRYLADLVQEWQLADSFRVTKGKASWVTRRGYAN